MEEQRRMTAEEINDLYVWQWSDYCGLAVNYPYWY